MDIEDVQMLPTERLGLSSADRKAVFDISCKDKSGKKGRLALEKYVESSSGENTTDRKGRADFQWDYHLKPVIFIGILNFKMSHEEGWPEDKYYSSYRLEEAQCKKQIIFPHFSEK